MKLDELKHLQQVKTQLQARRIALSDTRCQQGFEYLMRGLTAATRSESKALYLKALETFTQAFMQQRNNPEPCIGLAYLLLFIGDLPGAKNYTLKAQQLDPTQEHVPALLACLDALTTTARATSPDRPLPLLHPHSPITNRVDYDRLYQQTELLIITHVRLALEDQQTLAGPVLNASDLQNLKTKYTQLDTLIHTIRTQIKDIEAELDILALEQRLKPLNTLLNRLKTLITTSTTCLTLAGEITQVVEQSVALRKTLNCQKAPPAVRQQVETILDRCDQLADEIDALEHKGYQVKPLIDRYEQMLKEVEILQESLEECPDDL